MKYKFTLIFILGFSVQSGVAQQVSPGTSEEKATLAVETAFDKPDIFVSEDSNSDASQVRLSEMEQALLSKNPELRSFNFNTGDKAESYPVLSHDGLHLFFVHHQSVDWIFYTSRKSKSEPWDVPVPLKINGLNLQGPDNGEAETEDITGRLLSAAFAPDEKSIYVSGIWNGGAHLVYLKSSGERPGEFDFQHECTFEDKMGRKLEPGFLTSISFCNNGNSMFGYMDQDMAAFDRIGDVTWRSSYLLGTSGEIMGHVTRSGLHFIYTEGSGFNGDYDNKILLLRRGSLDEPFNTGNPYELYAFGDREFHLLQPDYSEESGELVFVLNDHPQWEHNNIYFTNADVNADLPHYVPEKRMVVEENDMPLEVEAPAAEFLRTERFYIADTTAAPAIKASKPVSDKSIENSLGFTETKIALGLPFPNPAASVIHFYYQSLAVESTESTKVWIYDISGKIVYQGILPSGNREGSINVSALAPGTYTLAVGISGMQSDGVRFSVAR